MFEFVKAEIQRGLRLGKEHGVRGGLKLYADETGMVGAIGIVTALGAVLIGLYIIAIVVGSLGTQVTTGSITLSSRWNTTLTTLDSNASSSFNIANILPIAIVGVGVMSIVVGAFSMRG